MNITGRLRVFICILLFIFLGPSVSLMAQNQGREVTKIGDFYLSIGAVADGSIWVFEISEQEPDPTRPFHFSQMVSSSFRVARPSFSLGGWQAQDITLSVSKSNPATINLKKADGSLASFAVSPYAPDGRLAGLSFSGDYSHLYGLGADFRNMSETLNLMGSTVMPGGMFGNRHLDLLSGYNPNQAMIPVLYGAGDDQKASAIFIDEVRPLMWDLQEAASTVAVAGPLGPGASFRFFLITGDSLASVRSSYMQIAGRPPLPPIGTFGVWAKPDRREQIVDWGAKVSSLRAAVPGLSGFSVNSLESFAALKGAAEAHGLSMMLDESAYVAKNSSSFNDLARRSFLLKQNSSEGPPVVVMHAGKESGIIDYSNPAAHTFWHSIFRQNHINLGVNFFRLIDSDLEDFSPSAYYQGQPGQDVHSHYAWANIFPLEWVHSINAGLANQRMRIKPRVLLISRTTTAGLARFGGALYNGETFIYLDTSAIATKAHVSLSGIDYYSSDISSSLRRWPLNPNTSQSYEVWLAKNVLVDFPLIIPEELVYVPGAQYNFSLRESLAPYYYSLAYQASTLGKPILSPLSFYFQEDLEARERMGEMMLGENMLLGLNLERGAERTEVYVPKGFWYNWHTGEMLHQESSGRVTLDTKIYGNIAPPILAKAGAIIPTVERVVPAEGAPYAINVLKVFIGEKESEFTWYEDDGKSRDYTANQMTSGGKTVIKAVSSFDGSTTVTIKAREGSWDGAPATRQFVFDVYGPQAPGEATLDNLPYNRMAKISELDNIESGWAASGNNHLRFKTPFLDISKDHVLWFK